MEKNDEKTKIDFSFNWEGIGFNLIPQNVILTAKKLIEMDLIRVRKDLENMPGVGRKTVNVVFGELDIEPNIAVDTHVSRVSKRLGLAKNSDDVLEIEMKLRRKFKRDTWNKRHKQLVLFGRYYCKAIKPECDTCKLKDICKK